MESGRLNIIKKLRFLIVPIYVAVSILNMVLLTEKKPSLSFYVLVSFLIGISGLIHLNIVRTFFRNSPTFLIITGTFIQALLMEINCQLDSIQVWNSQANGLVYTINYYWVIDG